LTAYLPQHESVAYSAEIGRSADLVPEMQARCGIEPGISANAYAGIVSIKHVSSH